MKILMVCLGNICRSPLAEGIMKGLAQQHGLDWEIDSAGTSGWHAGEPPDKRSIAVARKYGIDISGLQAWQFSQKDFDRFDKIFVMDAENYRDVISLARNEADKNKVELLMNLVQPGSNQAVPDPYWNDKQFEPVYQMIYQACEKFVKQHCKNN